ncbi:MAG: DUF2272 domain-containing protein [Verrucomicrobia bacterium]|nr:DUF2272 domain-containing protein [Verrucomicrobiota bacterium]
MSKFTTQLATIAEALHDKYHLMHESDPALAKEIKQFWSDTGQAFPGVSMPWSAVFVSACVKRAGATRTEFKFAAAHSVFFHQAIKNFKAGTGLFHGREIGDYAPEVGDIVQNNRNGNTFDYAHASMHSDYPSHSAIVIEKGTDGGGPYVITVGGNENDSIRRTLVRLDKNGLIKQIGARFIAIIQTLK